MRKVRRLDPRRNLRLGLLGRVQHVRLALELAQSTNSPATLLADTKTLWEEGEKKYGFRSDSVEVVRYLEELAEND